MQRFRADFAPALSVIDGRRCVACYPAENGGGGGHTSLCYFLVFCRPRDRSGGRRDGITTQKGSITAVDHGRVGQGGMGGGGGGGGGENMFFSQCFFVFHSFLCLAAALRLRRGARFRFEARRSVPSPAQKKRIAKYL